MQRAICLVLLLALVAPAFPSQLVAQETASSTEAVSAPEVIVEEEVRATTASTTEEVVVIEEVSGQADAESVPEESVQEVEAAALRAVVVDALGALLPGEYFVINQDDASQDIEHGGAVAGEDIFLEPGAQYTALASGEVTKVRMYLARNNFPFGIFSSWGVLVFDEQGVFQVCSLVGGQRNGATDALRNNIEVIPVGDSSDVTLIEFDEPGGNCVLEAGTTYTFKLVQRASIHPDDPSSSLYTKGTGGTDFFLQVLAGEPVEPPVCTENCFSSVMFLPGIKGSRLYSNDELLWEPGGNDDMLQLLLEPNGTSIRTDIVTKKHDVLGTAFGVINVYDDFLSDLATLYDERKILDYEAVSYDWRLSLDDLVNMGAESNGTISYSTATSTPYIEQTLRRLASTSHTGKVTIVAHSNGGLVAKALLLKIGDTETAKLVDKIIFVGVPQSGAPHAIASALYGYKEGIPPLVSTSVAREVTENSPATYHLLPSAKYFEDVQDSAHPVVKFSGVNHYLKEQEAYQGSIESEAELANFLLALEGGRSKPPATNTGEANVLNPLLLLTYGSFVHLALDSWVPPAGIELTQIAGWGLDTVAGIEFYEICPFSFCSASYRPIIVEDGDGVVPVPSALMTSTPTENIKRYWADLNEIRHDHGTIFEGESIRVFLKNILTNLQDVPFGVSETQPVSNSEKKLRLLLHSPLTLELYDEEGNHLGYNPDGSFDEEIEDAVYEEFGEVKYITVPAGKEYEVRMRGLDTGEFALEMQEVVGNTIIVESTIAEVPATPTTTASLTIGNGIETASPLTVDSNSDGVPEITLSPVVGEIVLYEPDITPPEAVLSFDMDAKAIQVAWVDAPFATSTFVSIGTGLSSTVHDEAGNPLFLGYSKNEKKSNSALLSLSALKYGTSATTTTSARLRYYWLNGTRGSANPSVLLTHIKTPSGAVLALYIGAKNKTIIMSATAKDDTADLAVLATTLILKPRATIQQYSGLVIPHVFTQEGKVEIGY